MSVKVTVNGYKLKVEDGDDIDITQRECGKCESNHTEVEIRRKGTRIARFGDDVYLHGDDETYGGTLLDEKGNPEPEHKAVVHLAKGLTEDQMHNTTLCGSPIHRRDQLVWKPVEVSYRWKDRICSECLALYNASGKVL